MTPRGNARRGDIVHSWTDWAHSGTAATKHYYRLIDMPGHTTVLERKIKGEGWRVAQVYQAKRTGGVPVWRGVDSEEGNGGES